MLDIQTATLAWVERHRGTPCPFLYDRAAGRCGNVWGAGSRLGRRCARGSASPRRPPAPYQLLPAAPSSRKWLVTAVDTSPTPVAAISVGGAVAGASSAGVGSRLPCFLTSKSLEHSHLTSRTRGTLPSSPTVTEMVRLCRPDPSTAEVRCLCCGRKCWQEHGLMVLGIGWQCTWFPLQAAQSSK